MPFVIRKIEPRYLCRGHVPQGGNASDCWPVGAEMGAVANGALTASLKQLASLLTTAEDIFADLTAELTSVADRSGHLRRRLDKLEERLSTVDPKKIPVPESDITTFARRTVHFRSSNTPHSSLFTTISRPKALRELYEAAAIVAVRSLDSLRRDRDAGSSMDMFMCTPVLGKRRRDKSLDIESRVPAALEDLRRWTSSEALGDVTVAPDCMSRILGDTTTDEAVDHKLPSPEEQVQAIALRFPAEIVAVDVSGRGFERMSMRRRSLLAGPECQDSTAVKRRSRPRRPRGKRRNTIAGTDQKEIRQAVGGETTPDEPEEILSGTTPRAHRSASTDILGSKKESPTEKKSHFNTLKAWGMSRLKLISPRSSQASSQQIDFSAEVANETSDERTMEGQSKTTEETNIYETVSTRRRRDKSHERKPSSSSSSGKSTSSIPVTMPKVEIRQSSVKLRESAAQRRERRKGTSRDDAPHSSSGNWSASSESGRASIGSETTTTTHPPRSTTTASIGTSSTSLCHMRRLKGRDTSASSSVTSEGTLTPDIIQDIAIVPFSDDGENSSVYSCDTEGYYTSFHMDSGLKTLREEEPSPQSPATKSSEVSSDPTSPIVENEYELFGRGSTSTTTSSAGTVCTALLAPVPPERKSSLTVVAMVHGQNQTGGESPDSGHNTSSSPVESASSPACTGRSCSEYEYSESSDLEGCDRIERIRSKTAINTSRIPSMCVITPPGSDDEQSKDTEDQDSRMNDNNKDLRGPGSVLMSATVGTSKMEVFNGQDKNLYATVQTVLPANHQNPNNPTKSSSNNQSSSTTTKTSPLSGVLGKLRGVLPLAGRKHASKNTAQDVSRGTGDSGDYVTIADVRNNNDKRQESANPTTTASLRSQATYANSDLFKRDAEYVSLSELPKKSDSSLERRRQGARVTLDSEGKVVYSSDSLKRVKGAHTTFNPGPFVKDGTSPSASPLLHRAPTHVRAVTKTTDAVDGPRKTASTPPTSPQLGKLIIRAATSPDRAPSPDYVRTPSTVVGPSSPTSPHRQVRGAYVNVQSDEGKKAHGGIVNGTEHDCTESTGRLDSNDRAIPEERRQQRNHKDQLQQRLKNQRHQQQHRRNARNDSTLNSVRNSGPLAPSNKCQESVVLPAASLGMAKCALADERSREKVRAGDENHPPASLADASTKIDNNEATKPTADKIVLGSLITTSSGDSQSQNNARTEFKNSVSARLTFEKSGLCPPSLRASGSTPKLSRKLLISDLDTPKFVRRNIVVLSEFQEIEKFDPRLTDDDEKSLEQDDRCEKMERGDRKIKRSESYRMANSPIMFIKKFSGHGDKTGKIFRTPSEELREELLKERINYPETVASPEPRVDDTCEFDSDPAVTSPLTTIPISPRPRALDLEPARVLKYSENALLPLPGESAPSSQVTSQTPPPYVGPPQPRDWQKVEPCVETRHSHKNISEDNRANYEHSQRNRYPLNICSSDNRRNLRGNETSNQPYYEPPGYTDNRRVHSQDIVETENARNQQYFGGQNDGKQQFFTLPTRRPTRDVEPPRSVTPDITRGLGRNPLNAVQMLVRRKPIGDCATPQRAETVDSNRRNNVEQIPMQGRPRVTEKLQQPSKDAKNRLVAPLGISAFGYRFFASSPVNEVDKKSNEFARHPAISPIAAGDCSNALKSSTPITRSNPTIAERLMSGNNCPSPIPGSSGRSTPTQSSTGRNTPTNLSIISPTRSTMSNEELFAAIYKSKRRLNIKEDTESLSPASSTSSLAKAQPGTRHSWSPESQKTPEIPSSQTIQSPSATSRLDFKRLLLQQSVKVGPTRLSAAEQLKLSRQQSNQQQQQHHHQQQQQHQQAQQHYRQQQYHQHQTIPQNAPQVPLAKVLSPRSVWRFQTPRTDVLSSTIIEDAAAEEKAMKPSPENPSSTSRPNTRRQLVLGDKLPDRLTRNDEQNERTRNEIGIVSSRTGITNVTPSIDVHRSEDTSTMDRTIVSNPSAFQQTRLLSPPYSQNLTSTPKFRQSNGSTPSSQSSRQLTVIGSQASASHNYENRRINNQLARAQFLAAVPATVKNNNNNDNDSSNNERQSAYFEKRFRARSESPQSTIARSVARSPSAPTLETAL